MPRRNQEAEDEAFAKALQDEYRQEYIRRQSERNGREDAVVAAAAAAAANTHRERSDRDKGTSSRHCNKMKSKGSKKKSSRSDSNDRTNSNNNNKNRNRSKSRSKSRDSTTSGARREKRRRRRQRSNSENASRMSEDEWITAQQLDRMEYEQSVEMEYGVIPLPPPPFVDEDSRPSWGSQMGSDAEYARRVQQELADEEYAHRLSERETRNQKPTVTKRPAPVEFPGQNHRNIIQGVPRLYGSKDSNSSSGSTGPLTDDDEAVARRIQQELADAEYAERINNLERQEAASRDVVLSLERQNQLNLAQQQQQQRRPKSCLATWVPMILCIAIAVTIPLLYVFDIFNPSDIPILGDLFEDDWVGGSLNNMTFDDVNGTLVPQLPSDAIGWANTGSGLQLDILNACADEWQPFVQAAIENWDNGSPIDSLSLYTSRVNYEYECTTVMGKLKICNGDYGNSQWRGINEVLLGPGGRRIIASKAKLNEFYLNFESDAQKLYTSCHELGHGFGLPHWDENFYNKDLGNCMDYTQNPHKSSKPDASNFLYLAQLYGGRDVSTNTELSASEATEMVHEDNDAEKVKKEESKNNGKKNAGLVLGAPGGSNRLLHNVVGKTSIPLSKSRIVLDGAPHELTPTRRILHADENAEIHIFPSPDYPGCTVMQHYLLVQKD